MDLQANLALRGDSCAVPREIDLALALRTIWRRKWLFAAIVGSALALAATVLLAITPKYTAEALTVIEPHRSILDYESVRPAVLTDVASIETQVELLRSPAMAAEVLRRLSLYDDPEFNPALKRDDKGVFQWLRTTASGAMQLPGYWINVFTRGGDSPSAADRDPSTQMIKQFLTKVSVAPKGRSFVIGVAVTTEDPAKSARIANAIVDAYMTDQSASRSAVGRDLAANLSTRLDDLRAQVTDAERAVEAYRQQAGLTWGNDGPITRQQLGELSTQLIAARTESAQAEARLKQFLGSASSPGAGIAMPEVLNSQLIQGLRQQEADIVRRLGDLSSVYGNDHPKIRSMRSELHDVRAMITSETKKILQSLTLDAERAERRVTELNKALSQVRGENDQQNQADVQLRELQRESEAKRSIYTTLLGRAEEIAIQDGFKAADARIVAAAIPPSFPSSPRITLIMLMVFVASAVGGAIMILWREYRPAGFQSKEEVEGILGYPVLGLVPTVRNAALAIPQRAALPPPAGYGQFQDAIRNVFVRVHRDDLPLQQPGAITGRTGAKVILITSSVMGEGKSMVSVSLAMQMARARRRSLLIDCDFYRPTIAKMLGVYRQQGLLHLLLGKAEYGDVVTQYPDSGLDVIGSGMPGFAGGDPHRFEEVKFLIPGLLGNELGSLLAALSGEYDFIIVDSPPVMATSDALVLCRHANECLFVVRWRRTRSRVAVAGLRQLVDAGASIKGLVLSRVDAREYAKYGFADSDTFLEAYQRYH
jgi:polysaccharide biosynthesis transport protein